MSDLKWRMGRLGIVGMLLLAVAVGMQMLVTKYHYHGTSPPTFNVEPGTTDGYLLTVCARVGEVPMHSTFVMRGTTANEAVNPMRVMLMDQQWNSNFLCGTVDATKFEAYPMHPIFLTVYPEEQSSPPRELVVLAATPGMSGKANRPQISAFNVPLNSENEYRFNLIVANTGSSDDYIPTVTVGRRINGVPELVPKEE